MMLTREPELKKVSGVETYASFQQDLRMDDDQFCLWQSMIRERTGMLIAEERRTFLETKVHMRMQESGCDTLQQYYELLTDGPHAFLEWTELVDRITTHETRFLRDPVALDFVVDTVLPDIAKNQRLHIWSAGCSTGEEAYGLAMLTEEFRKKNNMELRCAVTATDISLPCLSVARAGRYSTTRLNPLPEAFIKTYFEPDGGNHAVVNDSIKQRVCFAQMNLLESGTKPIGVMDLIYCQKVLIYLDQPVRHQLLDKMVLHLKPGGYLVLGVGEVSGWQNPNVVRVPGTDVLAFKGSKLRD